MKLKIKQNILMEHLNYAIKGISSKNLIPILNCIKFELTSDGLYLLSTDNELAIKTFIPSKKIENIDEVLENKNFIELLRKSIERRNNCIKSCNYYKNCYGGCNANAILNEINNNNISCYIQKGILNGIKDFILNLEEEKNYNKLNYSLVKIFSKKG